MFIKIVLQKSNQGIIFFLNGVKKCMVFKQMVY